jgi:hypothetical protein
MCPACIASAAMIVAGVMSTGGVAAVAVKARAKRAAEKLIQNKNKQEAS